MIIFTHPPQLQLPSSQEYNMTVMMNIKNPTIKYTIIHIKFIVNAVIKNPLFFYLHGE